MATKEKGIISYFKFTPGIYTFGDITLMSMEDQGVFINICCYYWTKKCSICLANAKQRFFQWEANINRLLDQEILKQDKEGFLIIEFLDEQWKKFGDVSRIRSESGSLGAEIKKANAKQVPSKCQANGMQMPIYKKRKEKKRKEVTEKNLMLKIPETEIPNLPLFLKISFEFWKLFKKITIEAGSNPTQIDKAKTKDWETEIRVALTKKECSEEQLRKIYIWLDKRKSKSAKFWAKNIKSTAKLREKIPALLECMNSEEQEEKAKSGEVKTTVYPGKIREIGKNNKPGPVKINKIISKP